MRERARIAEYRRKFQKNGVGAISSLITGVGFFLVDKKIKLMNQQER